MKGIFQKTVRSNIQEDLEVTYNFKFQSMQSKLLCYEICSGGASTYLERKIDAYVNSPKSQIQSALLVTFTESGMYVSTTFNYLKSIHCSYTQPS